MAANVESIVNRALQLLGAERIDSLTDNTKNAREMNAAYVPVRNALLRKYQWNFAIKRASVAADASEDLYEGLNRYSLPGDFMYFMREPRSSFWREQRRDWQVEGNFVLTSDGSPLEFRYVGQDDNVTRNDPLFDELLAINLALATCKRITGSLDLKADLKQDQAIITAEARRSNAFENDSDDMVIDTWTQTMYTNGWVEEL